MHTHKIAIPNILEVGPGKLKGIAGYIAKAKVRKVILFFGDGIKELFGRDILPSLNESPEIEVLNEYICYENTMEYITETAYTLPQSTEAIIGIGGGKVLDCAKYIAFLNGLPFISVPTSLAHDGFAGSGCSLFIKNRRSSVHAYMPFGIIVDTSVVMNAPEKFIYSGIGDVVSKITAAFDWQFEEQQGVTRVDDVAVMMAKKSVNSIVRMPFDSIKEYFFIKELIDSLTMSGIAMEIAGNSCPASGSEHLISHALDKMTTNPQLHGIQVGVATYIMSIVQNHRQQRVRTFLTDTGFFDFVKTLQLNEDDYFDAIDIAPSIKPNRKTYIHFEENRVKAKQIIKEDSILQEIFNSKVR